MKQYETNNSPSVSTSFIFWEEVTKIGRYQEIIPDRELGLIILRLFDLTEKKKTLSEYFKHSDIEEIYWEVNPTAERKQRQDARNAIEKLKQYFLTYSAVHNEYHLRDHAKIFGAMAYELLEARFNPTLVEQICRTLRFDLHSKIQEGKFKDWYDVFFSPNRSALQQQLDLLDNKIDNLVSELQRKQLDDSEVLTMLQSVSNQLSRILEEYEQLRSAYAETKTIRSELSNFQNNVPDNERDILEEALEYFENLRKLLNTINERLGRIQPKIQQLFGVFNRANFSAKAERFIRYLVMESNLTNGRVILLTGIPSFIHQIKSTNLKFFNPNRSLFPRPIQSRPVHSFDAKERELAFLHTSSSARLQDEANEWLTLFEIDLKKKGEIMLSDYFPKVFQDDWSRFEVTLRFIYLVLQQYSNHNDWQLDINKPDHSSPYRNLQLWTMRVFRKNSFSSTTL